MVARNCFLTSLLVDYLVLNESNDINCLSSKMLCFTTCFFDLLTTVAFRNAADVKSQVAYKFGISPEVNNPKKFSFKVQYTL